MAAEGMVLSRHSSSRGHQGVLDVQHVSLHSIILGHQSGVHVVDFVTAHNLDLMRITVQTTEKRVSAPSFSATTASCSQKHQPLERSGPHSQTNRTSGLI